jgi:hypothetical protein
MFAFCMRWYAITKALCLGRVLLNIQRRILGSMRTIVRAKRYFFFPAGFFAAFFLAISIQVFYGLCGTLSGSGTVRWGPGPSSFFECGNRHDHASPHRELTQVYGQATFTTKQNYCA